MNSWPAAASLPLCFPSTAQAPTSPTALPTPPEQALLADERRSGRAREARHKLTVERLRQQVRELQERNAELRGQVAALEEQRLAAAWGPPTAGAAAGGGPAGGSPGGPAGGSAPSVQRHAPAASPGRSSAPPAAAAASLTRQARPGGLPSVRVERGGGLSAHQPAAAQPPLEDEAEDAEQLIAEVRLSDEEVVVCEAEAPEEAYGQQAQQAQQRELGAGEGAAWSCGALHSSSTWTAAGGDGVSAWDGAALGAAQPAGDTASRATSALARFNQLRDALSQQRHGLGGSRPGSLQASPTAAAALGGADLPGAGCAPLAPAGTITSAAAHAEDDLRRLGRSMLAASSGSSPAGALAPAAPAPEPEAALGPVAASPTAAAVGGSPSGGGGGGGDPVVSEIQHPDGRWERLHASGLREQRFANGSVRQSAPGGATLTRFANGDVKKALPGGVVEYWYAQVDSWQVRGLATSGWAAMRRTAPRAAYTTPPARLPSLHPPPALSRGTTLPASTPARHRHSSLRSPTPRASRSSTSPRARCGRGRVGGVPRRSLPSEPAPSSPASCCMLGAGAVLSACLAAMAVLNPPPPSPPNRHRCRWRRTTRAASKRLCFPTARCARRCPTGGSWPSARRTCRQRSERHARSRRWRDCGSGAAAAAAPKGERAAAQPMGAMYLP